MHPNNRLLPPLLVVLALCLAACNLGVESNMPNPASVHCEDNGGVLDIRNFASGDVGMCIFDDGSECEEWAYFNGACQPGDYYPNTAPEDEPVGMPNPASVFCEDNGGTLDIRTADDGGQTGYCIFVDGSECEEWAFFNGECQPGEYLP